jgi:predicted RNase H-like HicB family nuclease/uncharacterized damage-inducible protein DinB
MLIRFGVEEIEQNHWVAWALNLPGCFSSARTQEEALIMAPTAVAQYLTWLKNHGHRQIPRRENIEVEVVATFRSYVRSGMYVVNAFFEADRKALTADEIQFALWLVERTREDLMEVVDRVPPEKLQQPIASEVQGSIQGILEHLAWSEWSYFDRLGLAFDRDEMPAEPFQMLDRVRSHSRQQLPALEAKALVVNVRGEDWSPRKVLRWMAWHERDHTSHIAKLMSYI